MVSRRDFLKRAALATAGSALAVSNADAISNIAAPIIGAKKNVNINRKGKGGKMTLKFFPYELKLQHVFTVATYTRTTTPDVQVDELLLYGELAGYIGYGAEQYIGKIKHFDTLRDITEYLKAEIKPGTAVLFKGSRGMKLNEVVDGLLG